MRVMDELTEAAQRRTPSFQHAGGQSPRVGSSCAGAVYHLIHDWNLSKRFSSTKRIIADRPNQDAFYARRDGSFTDHPSTAASKLPLKSKALSPSRKTPSALQGAPSPASVKSDATSKRSPGVVARLMGLESFPDRTCKSSSKSGSPRRETASLDPPPVLLQELLRLELQHSKKSFKDKLPSFTKKGLDPKGAMSHQMKQPRAHLGKDERPYVNSRAVRPSSLQKDMKGSMQPFLARLHKTGAPPMVPSSVSQSSHSPILSPSMLGGRNTVRLLEAAVKALDPPVPRRKYSLTLNDSHRSESSRPEKRAFGASSYGRGGTPVNSATKPGRSRSRSGKDDRSESNSPGSRSTSRARYESSRQARYDTTLTASSRSVSPKRSHRSKPDNLKRTEDSPRPLLRTHEASIRGFKINLGDSPLGKKLKKNDSYPQAVELAIQVPLTPSPNLDHVKTDSPEPCTPDRNPTADISQSSPSIVSEKPRGFRSIRFRSRSGKQEKLIAPSPSKETGEANCKDQGKHGSPSEEKSIAPSPPKEAGEGNCKDQGKHGSPSEEKSIAPSPPKEAGEVNCNDRGKHGSPSEEKPIAPSPPKGMKVAGFSYNTLFRKQGNKKEGNETGEALVMKRTDSTWMRHLLRKPRSIPWTSKLSKKVNAEVTESVEPEEDLSQEPASSPTHQREGPAVVQARYRSIDDVFPELPVEEKDAHRPSPELARTIRAVEELQFLRQGDADYRSIERMFGKDFSRSLMAAELTSPEMSPTSNECRIPGTFPNSPKYEAMDLFSTRSQLNLHDMFEVVSGNRSHDSTSRRRSFCLSEPRERILNDEEAEEAESETCSNSIGGTPEYRQNHKISVAVGWMTPPALREFENKLSHEGVMSTPPALKKFEEKLAFEDLVMSTPPALKQFEEKLEHDGAMSTPPALKKFEEKLENEGAMSTPPALKKFEEKLENEGAMSTPPALKNFEEKLENEGAMSTPPALKKFEEKLEHEGAMSTPPALKKFEEKLENEGAISTQPALVKFEEKLEHEGAMSTPPALKKFEEGLASKGAVSTPRALKTFEEKLAHEGVMTPPALKKFEEKLAQGFSDLDDSHVLCPDEFGQPSPVSVLQSPFLDEVPTTPDASLAEAQHVGDSEPSAVEDDDEDESQEANENTATSKLSDAAIPEMIQTDMIEQAILDISRIRSIDVTSIGLEPQIIAPVEPQQEKNYIKEVLDLLREADLPWHSAVNQSLFKRLEFGSRKQGPSGRSERKLLFDSVHEVMALEPWLKTSSFYVELPMFPDLHANSKFRSQISGEDLVHEVHRMYCHWKDIAGNCLDDLIDYDMNVPEGRWVNFGHEVADVGLDIERTLLHVLIAEVVDDLTSLVATRG